MDFRREPSALSHPGVTVIIDAAVAEVGAIYCSVGRTYRALEIAAADLMRISEAQVAAITSRTAV